jgi:hypothetical protein
VRDQLNAKLVGWQNCFRYGTVAKAYPAVNLTTYVGRVDVARTYRYLEAVPGLLQLDTEHLGGRHAGGGK